MEIVILNTKNRNTFTILDLKSKKNCEYLNFIFNEKDIRNINRGNTINNCKLMNGMQSEKYMIIEDCLNNDGKNLEEVKIYKVHKLFVDYTIYKYGKYKVKIRDK